MSAMVNLELDKWRDATVRLSFWDSAHGHDRFFVLHADGSATEETENENETLVNTPVNLVFALRELLAKVEASK